MSGRIALYDPSDVTSGDMIVLTSGGLDVYNKIDGVRRQTTFLNNVICGTATANQWSELGGFWKEAPVVALSIKKGPGYFANYPLSGQRFTLTPIIGLVRDGVYRMYPELTFYAGAVSVNWSTGISMADYDTLGQPRNSCAYPESCTPFYPSTGGVLTVNFQYKSGVQDILYGSTACDLYLRNEFFLDVCRGTSYSSYLLYSIDAWSTNYNWQDVSTSYDVGDGFCTWRIRRVITRLNARTNGGITGGRALDFGLVSYSFSSTEETSAPTDAEVFYLAVGR